MTNVIFIFVIFGMNKDIQLNGILDQGKQMNKHSLYLAFVLLLTFPSPTQAEELSWVVSGQYRPRFEVNNRTLQSGTEEDVVVSHRARIGLTLAYGSWLVQFQPQDVRQWGTEASTLAAIGGNIDFHQAYVQGKFLENQLFIKVGRQELIYDDQRLIGAVDWAQQGRAFDGGLFRFESKGIRLTADVFAAYLIEGGDKDRGLYGLHADYSLTEISFSVLSTFEYDSTNDYIRSTSGVRMSGTPMGFIFDIAGYGQFGFFDTAGVQTDMQAWLFAARVGYEFNAFGKLTVGADVLSGDDDLTDTTVNAFDTLYATNHKWYGHMDYFLNIPVHTAQLGLIDLTAAYQVAFLDNFVAGLVGHWFATQVQTTAGNQNLGIEVDASIAYKFNKFIKLVGGYSVYIADEAMVDIGRAGATSDTGHWAWLQTDVNF